MEIQHRVKPKGAVAGMGKVLPPHFESDSTDPGGRLVICRKSPHPWVGGRSKAVGTEQVEGPRRAAVTHHDRGGVTVPGVPTG